MNNHAKVVLCPISNLKLRDGYPRIESLSESGIHPAVATDGFATNNSANLLEELKTISLLCGGRIPNKQLLDMITVNPAIALRGNNQCGMIVKDYQTNISMFLTERYNMMDYETTISNLIFNNTAFQCRYVISNGKMILREGNPVFIDKNKVIEDYCSLYEYLYETGDDT